MSCTPLEVSRTGGDQHLPLSDHALTASPADGTVGIHHHRACLQKNIHKPFLQRLQINAVGRRCDQKPYVRMYLSSFQDTGAYTQLADPAIVAGTEERFIDLYLSHLC